MQKDGIDRSLEMHATAAAKHIWQESNMFLDVNQHTGPELGQSVARHVWKARYFGEMG